MAGLQDYCGVNTPFARVLIYDGTHQKYFSFKLDENGNLVPYRSIKRLKKNVCSKVLFSSRLVHELMINDDKLMNQFDELCTKIEKDNNVETIISDVALQFDDCSYLFK